MAALTTAEAFPEIHTHEQDGWKVTIHCNGVFTEWIRAYADAGHPKGFVTLEGVGVEVTVRIGNDAWGRVSHLPVNLRHGRRTCRQLAYELKAKYNKKPDYAFLHTLCKKAFEPYDSHYL